MPNTHWKKIFTLLSEENLSIVRSNWKLLHDPQIYEWVGLPAKHDLLDEGLRDGVWQPISYRDIEYIEIPRQCSNPMDDPQNPSPTVNQPIVAVKKIMEGQADLPFFFDEEHLVIKGNNS